MKKEWAKLIDDWKTQCPPDEIESFRMEEKWMRKLARTKDGEAIVVATLKRRLSGQRVITPSFTGYPNKPMSNHNVTLFPSSSIFFRHVRTAQAAMYRLRIQQQRDPASIDYDGEIDKVLYNVERAIKFHQPRLVREKRALEELWLNVGRFCAKYQDTTRPLIGRKKGASVSIEALHEVFTWAEQNADNRDPISMDTYEGNAESQPDDFTMSDEAGSGFRYETNTALMRRLTWDIRPANADRTYTGSPWPKTMMSPTQGRGEHSPEGGFFDRSQLSDGKELNSYLAKRKRWDEERKLKAKHEDDGDRPWNREYHNLPFKYIEEPVMEKTERDTSCSTLTGNDKSIALFQYVHNAHNFRGHRRSGFGGRAEPHGERDPWCELVPADQRRKRWIHG